MNINDFKFMRNGRVIQNLDAGQLDLISPVFKKNKQTGRALLMFHGFSSTPAVYRFLIPSLANYDVISCPILPGHGESIESFAQVSAQQWIEAAERKYMELITNYQQIDVMGLSLGGVLACHLAMRYPINHLYLLAPAFAIRLNTKCCLHLATLFSFLGIRSIKNRAGNLYSNNNAELAYARLPISVIKEILTLIDTFQCKPISCPTDIFLGRHDRVVHNEKITELTKQFTNVKLHWLEHSAHVLPLDGDYQEIIDSVNRV